MHLPEYVNDARRFLSEYSKTSMATLLTLGATGLAVYSGVSGVSGNEVLTPLLSALQGFGATAIVFTYLIENDRRQ